MDYIDLEPPIEPLELYVLDYFDQILTLLDIPRLAAHLFAYISSNYMTNRFEVVLFPARRARLAEVLDASENTINQYIIKLVQEGLLMRISKQSTFTVNPLPLPPMMFAGGRQEGQPFTVCITYSPQGRYFSIPREPFEEELDFAKEEFGKIENRQYPVNPLSASYERGFRNLKANLEFSSSSKTPRRLTDTEET